MIPFKGNIIFRGFIRNNENFLKPFSTKLRLVDKSKSSPPTPNPKLKEVPNPKPKEVPNPKVQLGLTMILKPYGPPPPSLTSYWSGLTLSWPLIGWHRPGQISDTDPRCSEHRRRRLTRASRESVETISDENQHSGVWWLSSERRRRVSPLLRLRFWAVTEV